MATGAGQHEQFSLVAGGPFHAVLRRLGLIGDDLLPLRKAGVSLALAAWSLPAILAALQSLVDGAYSGWDYFTDLTVYSRFLVAIAVMVATERFADGRLAMLARQFRKADLISTDALPRFREAVAKTDRYSSSGLAEGVLAFLAFVWSGVTARIAIGLPGANWEGGVSAEGVDFSWAGLAARMLSNPLFLFLVLRWCWRFLLWALLLYRISKLPLQLTPLHPDRSSGLGFLAIYPSIFGGFLFAMSCVVASAMLKDLSVVDHSSRTIGFVIAGWLVISVGFFLGPLLVFSRPLYLGRERAMLEYGSLGTQHHLAFRRRWIGGERHSEELLGHADISSVADLNGSFEIIEQIRIVPVNRSTVLGLLGAAGVPMLAVVATRIPLVELLKLIAGAIF